MHLTHLHLLLALALSAPAVGGAPSTTFTYVDLGTLGGPGSSAWGLNDNRQVVGWAHASSSLDCDGRPCRRAFMWDNGTMIDLGILAGDEESLARAINNVGLIVGTSERDVIAGSGVFQAFSWESGTMSGLPDLGVTGSCFARDVNENGLIIGHAPDAVTSQDRTVTWTAGAITDISAGESHTYNRALGVNDSGVIVGMAWNLFQPNDAILFDGSTWFTIGGFGQFQNAEANDVNNTGLAAGLMAFPSGDWHAALWTETDGIDLGTLPGLPLSELYDVNDAGQAVGRAYDFDSRAIYYDGAELHDLNDFVPADFDGVLFEAREINEAGDIAGTALIDGEFRAFLMTVGAPCPADIDGSGDVGFSDLVALLSSWGPCAGCDADLTGDGTVAFDDLITLLSSWGPCQA